jgi:hypothetical protein
MREYTDTEDEGFKDALGDTTLTSDANLLAAKAAYLELITQAKAKGDLEGVSIWRSGMTIVDEELIKRNL